MTRGHGQHQRRILDRLAQHAVTAGLLGDFEVAGEPYPSYLPVSALAENTSRSAVGGTRRAVRRLEDEGLVTTLYVWKGHPRGPGQLCARLVADGATEAEWRRRRAERDAARQRH